MNCSTPGLPVHHQHREPTQTHAHWVGDAIQPSHPLSSPSFSCPQSFPASWSFLTSRLFASDGQSIGASVLASFQRTPRTDLLYNGLVGSPCSPRGSQISSPTPQFKSINSLVLSLLYSPTLTSIHDYWKKP